MLPLGIGLLVVGWLLVHSGYAGTSPLDEIRSAFGG